MTENEIRFLKSDFESSAAFVEKYKQQIAIPYDDFLEDFILESDFYAIGIGAQQAGFFGVNNQRLTILYVDDSFYSKGNRIFEQIMITHGLKDAFIPITDLGALSIVLEKHKEIKIQALHFSDAHRAVRPPEFERECFRLAAMADLDEIQRIAGDFLDDYAVFIAAQELYVLEKENEMLGLGLVISNKIMEACASIGVFTREDRRSRGVGRSILLHLKDAVYAAGMMPVAGCGYANTESRLTLESAGFITKSKLLRVIL